MRHRRRWQRQRLLLRYDQQRGQGNPGSGRLYHGQHARQRVSASPPASPSIGNGNVFVADNGTRRGEGDPVGAGGERRHARPSAGPTNGGNSVTISGTRLGGASAICLRHHRRRRVSLSTAPPRSPPPRQPAALRPRVDVTVTTPGRQRARPASRTTIPMLRHQWSVRSARPPARPPAALAVIITGTNLTGATGVKFGTAAATAFVVEQCQPDHRHRASRHRRHGRRHGNHVGRHQCHQLPRGSIYLCRRAANRDFGRPIGRSHAPAAIR